MATEPSSKPSFSPRRKWSIGLNVLVIVLIVFSVVGMINYLSRDYFLRFHWSSLAKAELSPLTVKFLQSVTNQVKVTLFYDKSEPLYSTISALLNEYRLINSKISVETVDYLRDPAAAQKLKEKYKLMAASDKNLIIFDCEGRSKPLPGDGLAKYVLEQLPNATQPEFRRKPTEFLGERVFTSTLLEIVNPKKLNAYVLQGHFEHPITSGDAVYGYLKFASLMAQNNLRVEPLSLVGTNPVPADCHLLVIPGPRDRLADAELEKIDQYLTQGGRLLILFNAYSANKETGLERVLAKWGVEVGSDIIIDPENYASEGRDIVVRDFATHQIVNPLLQSAIYLVSPRSIGTLKGRPQELDAPRVEELAFTGPKAYALHDPAREQNRFPLIVAVEKPAPKGIITDRGSCRIVVVGDSICLANRSIESIANRDFAGFAINWLLDRSQLLEALGSSRIPEYKLVMTKAQLQRSEWLLLAAMPGSVLVLGTCVWLRRRR